MFSGKSHEFKADLITPIGSGSGFQASSFNRHGTPQVRTRRLVRCTRMDGLEEEVTVRLLWKTKARGRLVRCGTRLQKASESPILSQQRGR